MGKFRGWHIVAGIAAMVLTGILGTAMGLNNTATFMSSCVAFVAVAMWVDSRITLRRRARARGRARGAAREPGIPGRPSGEGVRLDAEPPNRDGHAG